MNQKKVSFSLNGSSDLDETVCCSDSSSSLGSIFNGKAVKLVSTFKVSPSIQKWGSSSWGQGSYSAMDFGSGSADDEENYKSFNILTLEVETESTSFGDSSITLQSCMKSNNFEEEDLPAIPKNDTSSVASQQNEAAQSMVNPNDGATCWVICPGSPQPHLELNISPLTPKAQFPCMKDGNSTRRNTMDNLALEPCTSTSRLTLRRTRRTSGTRQTPNSRCAIQHLHKKH
jgi:hypothetical protein